MSAITDRDIIIIVRDRLLKQGEKSIDDDTSCRYRGYKQSTIDEAKEYSQLQFPEEQDPYAWIDAFYSILADAQCDAKCAIGHLISDGLYYTGIEGEAIDEHILELVVQSNPEWNRGPESYLLLKELQNIHDNVSIYEWNQEFELFINMCDKDGNWVNQERQDKDGY